MIFSSIIWNAAYPYRQEILSDIMKLYPISNVYTYNLTGVYDAFVRDVYKADNIPIQRVDSKLEYMSKFSENSIVRFDIDIAKLTEVYMPRKQRNVFAEPEQLKEQIRRQYSTLIKPYFFDIILHMTETEQERQALNIALAKYSNLKTEFVIKGKDAQCQK